jgi:integrase
VQNAAPAEMGAATEREDDAMAELKVVDGAPRSALARLVDDYLINRKAAGASRKTIANLELALKRIFLPWCAEQVITDVSQLTSRHLDRLTAQLLDHGGARGELSKSSAWTYTRNVRLFLDWARAEGEKVEAKIQLPKLGKPMVEVLDRDEIQRIEDTAGSERDKVIVRVLADAGLRVGELVKLRINDVVDHDRKPYLRVAGRSQGGGAKGDRTRLVPVSPILARRLRRYAERQRPADAKTDRLFVAQRRAARSGEYEPLTESGVQQLVRDLGAKAEITKRVHPHVFRHSAATWMLRRGTNPLLVAQILGHESLAMITRTYSHLTVDDAHEALMAALQSGQ